MKNAYLFVFFYYLATLACTVRAQVPQTLDWVTIYLKTHTTQNAHYVRVLNVMGRELHSTANPG